jgi:hypothetical protein
MTKSLFFLLFFAGFALALDESPMASFVCQLCSSGSPLAQQLLPVGMTCLDLDAAMQNIGKDGCLSLRNITAGGTSGSINQTNATQVWEAYQNLQSELDHEKSYATQLLIAVIVLSILIPMICLGSGIIIWTFWKKTNDDAAAQVFSMGGLMESQLPTNHAPLKYY